jgi:hypothetical protein
MRRGRIGSKPSSDGLAPTWPFGVRTHIVESNQVNIFAFTVFRDLEQIYDTQESGLARQCWSDIRKTDRLDGIHFDLTFLHAVPVAHFDMGPRPDSDTASDFSSTNSLAKPLGEHHEESLHSAEGGGGFRGDFEVMPWFESHKERTSVMWPTDVTGTARE